MRNAELMARWTEAADSALKAVEEEDEGGADDDDEHTSYSREHTKRVFREFLGSQREAVERALRTDPRAPMALCRALDRRCAWPEASDVPQATEIGETRRLLVQKLARSKAAAAEWADVGDQGEQGEALSCVEYMALLSKVRARLPVGEGGVVGADEGADEGGHHHGGADEGELGAWALMGHALPPSSRPFAASHTFSSAWDAQRSALLLFGKRTGDAAPRLLLPPSALLPAEDEDESAETADVHPVDLLAARMCADTMQRSEVSPFCLLIPPTSDAEAAARNAVVVLQSDTLVRSCEGDGGDVASTAAYNFDRLDATAAVAVPRLVAAIMRARQRWRQVHRLAGIVNAFATELLDVYIEVSFRPQNTGAELCLMRLKQAVNALSGGAS
jgi:hypothetical protein